MKVKRSEYYRYLVAVSVKNLAALEELLYAIFEDEDLLLIDLKERKEYKEAAEED